MKDRGLRYSSCGAADFGARSDDKNANTRSFSGLDISEYALLHCEPEVVGRLHLGDIHNPLPFPDHSFDAVVSHWLMHETYFDAVPKIFAETRRLLKPGGIMMHFDLPRFCDMEPVNAFLASWEARNVAEYFAADYRVMDIVGEAQKAAASEKDRAVREIVAAKNEALHELADKSVGTAVDLAGRIVGRQLKQSDHESLIVDALDKFSSNN